MSDLSPETEKLLALARGAGTLTDARRAQIKAGLLTQIAAGGVVGGAATHALWGKAAWFSSPFVKGLSALALLSAVGAGVYVGARASASNSAVVSASSAKVVPAGAAVDTTNTTSNSNGASAAPNAQLAGSPTLAAPATTDRASAPSAAVESGSTPSDSSRALDQAEPSNVARPNPSARNTVIGSHPSSAPASAGANAPNAADTLAEETSLLREADRALRAGNAQRVLSLLAEDAERFPRGALAPERAAEQMIARCQLGQIDAKTAQSYLAAHASSPFAARLADACHVSR